MATREEEWGNVLSLREKGNLNVVLRDRLMTDAALGGPRPIKSEHSYSLLACSPPPSPATRNSNQHTPNSISIEGFAGSTCISINSNLHSVEHHKTLGLRSRIDGTDIVFHGIYSIVFIFKRLYLFLFAFFWTFYHSSPFTMLPLLFLSTSSILSNFIFPVFLIFYNYIFFIFPTLSLIFFHFLFPSFHTFNFSNSHSLTNSFSPILSFHSSSPFTIFLEFWSTPTSFLSLHLPDFTDNIPD